MEVNEAITKLRAADKARLDFNFEQNESDFVKIGENLYVGVFLDRVERLEIIARDGNWATARKKPRSDNDL